MAKGQKGAKQNQKDLDGVWFRAGSYFEVGGCYGNPAVEAVHRRSAQYDQGQRAGPDCSPSDLGDAARAAFGQHRHDHAEQRDDAHQQGLLTSGSPQGEPSTR